MLLTSDGLISLIEQTEVKPLSGLNINSYIQSNKDLHQQLEAEASNSTTIRIFDIFGRQLYTTNTSIEKGINTLNFPLSMTSGIYILSITDGSEYQSKKFYWK